MFLLFLMIIIIVNNNIVNNIVNYSILNWISCYGRWKDFFLIIIDILQILQGEQTNRPDFTIRCHPVIKEVVCFFDTGGVAKVTRKGKDVRAQFAV